MEVRLDVNNETIFLTQQQVCELFNVQKAAISKYAKNIFNIGELATSTGCYEIETWHERHAICCPHFFARYHM